MNPHFIKEEKSENGDLNDINSQDMTSHTLSVGIKPEVDVNDMSVWDDALLVTSWDQAVAEYKKYHSIHKSGKRLEDVLTEEELEELREDYSDVLDEPEITPKVEDDETEENQSGADMSFGESDADEADSDLEELVILEQEQQEMKQEPVDNLATQEQTAPRPMRTPVPQAILETVQDESVKNMMMSWYYAGYYTGLHAGQQQQPKDATPRE